MNRFIKLFAITLASVLCLVADGAQQGGYPSRPNFQSATIKNVAVATTVTGSGTLTYSSGCSSGGFGPAYTYAVTGSIVAITFTANSICPTTAATVIATGLPAVLFPASNKAIYSLVVSNNLDIAGVVGITTAGALSASLVNGATFTTNGGVQSTIVITYNLN